MARLTALWILAACGVPLFAHPVYFFQGVHAHQNNRAQYSAYLQDLSRRYGVPVELSFGTRNESMPGRVFLDEEYLDEKIATFALVELGIFQRPHKYLAYCESLGRFVLAHEFFHVALKHNESYRESFARYGDCPRTRWLRMRYEMQADYLAALELKRAGLSILNVIHLVDFDRDFDRDGGTRGDGLRFERRHAYPSPARRVEVLFWSLDSLFHFELFDVNESPCGAILASLQPEKQFPEFAFLAQVREFVRKAVESGAHGND